MHPSSFPTVLSSALLTICCAASGTDAFMEERTEQDHDPLMAEDLPSEMDRPINDIRLGGGAVQKLTISERVTTPAGTHADYDWRGLNDWGPSLGFSAVGTLHQFRRHGALLVGVGATMQMFDITPDSYRVGGASFPNGRRDLDLQYQTVSLDLMFGYGTGAWNTRFGAWHLEALAIGSGGLAWADTQGFDSTGTAVRRRGAGWQYAYGPRLGAYLTEHAWVFGVHADYLFSHGEVGITLPNGDKSVVTAEGDGTFAAQVEIGRRF
ncbi:MAG: hypothetical protein H0W83_10025 [Planctomycetes bacterium]|nr:hypothetical protein [Planctomycetota bacterium]